MTLLSLLPENFKERLRRRAGAITSAARLKNLARAGFAPAQIIDAGAYRGDWAREAAAAFPGASILMIEPQPHLAPRLAGLAQASSRLRFRPGLLGASAQPVKFLVAESNSRILDPASVSSPEGRIVTMDAERLSDVAAAEGFARCGLLKLDLQGHELEALQGAGPMFGEIEAIMSEVSLLPVGQVPIFQDLAEAFRERGYRLYDVFGQNHRPLDGALWQMDVVYVRKDSPLLARAHIWS